MENNLIDKIFNEFYNEFFKIKNGYYFYNEKEQEYSIFIEAPGLKKEDFNIEINPHEIKIKGKLSNKEIEKFVNKKEYDYILNIPHINEETVNAKLEDGILMIKFKDDKKSSNKKIVIN